jgi:hypothetical protein
MKDGFERLINQMQICLTHLESGQHEEAMFALQASIATLHMAATDVAMRASELAVETAEVHRLSAALHVATIKTNAARVSKTK